MKTVLLAALLVGGSTLLGALAGFFFRGICRRFARAVMGFAAGVMLFSSFSGLLLPALSYGGWFTLPAVLAGIFGGALFLGGAKRLFPDADALPVSPSPQEGERDGGRLVRAGLLFVLAIAVHNLPEGMAAGVGFGTGDEIGAFFIAGGIALQNLPEGMLVVAPLLAAGYSKAKTFLLAALTGMIEIAGTFLGFFAARISFVLPLALSFAGGTMLFIIVDQMLPCSNEGGDPADTAYALLAGVCVMLVGEVLLR